MKDDLGTREITSSAHDVQDTVAAISTPPGPGGVGMVRVTGPDAVAVGQKVFTPTAKSRQHDPEPMRARVGHVHQPGNPDEPIDTAVWLFFKGPRSYTGEDTVEITAHGGPLVMRRVLEAVTASGARLAEPGEFTRRAFENGRIDLSQAEAVASLIFASTNEAMDVMRRQVEGAMGREALVLRGSLLEAKVRLESAIDFPEEVEEADPRLLAQPVGEAMERAQRLLETSKEGIAMSEGLKVVIVGAPNVGKSSLLNALLEEDRAIVHETAGTTRDFIEGRISVQGIPMVVVDTAGIRDETGDLEGEGIVRTRSLMKGADLLLILLDGSRALSRDEEILLEETSGTRRVIASNKSDLSAHPDHADVGGAVKVSALTGSGLEELKGLIHDTYTEGGQATAESDAVVTTLRQARALERVREGCGRFLDGVSRSREAVLLAVDLEEALLGVGELTGEVTADEVLEEIFSRFCIGK